MRRNVQVYILESQSNKLLLLKRTQERSGNWQPVCGGIEPGEHAIDAAKREVHEETGITCNSPLTKLSYEFDYKTTKDGVLMDMNDVCFLMRLPYPFDITLSHEHEVFEWINLTSINDYTEWEPIRTVVKDLSDLYAINSR